MGTLGLIIIAQLAFGRSQGASPVHCPQNWFYLTTSFLLYPALLLQLSYGFFSLLGRKQGGHTSMFRSHRHARTFLRCMFVIKMLKYKPTIRRENYMCQTGPLAPCDNSNCYTEEKIYLKDI